MLYLVIERFKNKDAGPVYRRFQERGRMMPPGLTYLQSWVDRELSQCFQLMECEKPALIDEWTRVWDDIVDFEVIPVVTSQDAVAALGSLGRADEGKNGDC